MTNPAQPAAGAPWYEDERFWAVIDYLLSDPKRPIEQDAAQISKLLGLAKGARVLDLCCGTGRYCVALARLGYEVTGVDRTRPYLDQARALAAEQGVKVEYVEGDMREFRREGGFDAAINVFTSFGYFEELEDDLRVLRNLHASLRPGGRLLMDMAGREALAAKYTPRDWMEFADGALLLFDREVLPGWSELGNRWIFLKNGERTEFNFTHRVYSGDSLARALRDAGFSIEGIYGSLDGTPYDRSAARLVAVARKR